VNISAFRDNGSKHTVLCRNDTVIMFICRIVVLISYS